MYLTVHSSSVASLCSKKPFIMQVLIFALLALAVGAENYHSYYNPYSSYGHYGGYGLGYGSSLYGHSYGLGDAHYNLGGHYGHYAYQPAKASVGLYHGGHAVAAPVVSYAHAKPAVTTYVAPAPAVSVVSKPVTYAAAPRYTSVVAPKAAYVAPAVSYVAPKPVAVAPAVRYIAAPKPAVAVAPTYTYVAPKPAVAVAPTYSYVAPKQAVRYVETKPAVAVAPAVSYVEHKPAVAVTSGIAATPYNRYYSGAYGSYGAAPIYSYGSGAYPSYTYSSPSVLNPYSYTQSYGSSSPYYYYKK